MSEIAVHTIAGPRRVAVPAPTVVAAPVFIALGSNLDNPVRQVSMAFEELALVAGVELVARSSLYRTAPMGYTDQPDFINAVAKVRTTLSPEELLSALHAIEAAHGRRREFADGPRTLDLDIVSFGALQRHAGSLLLPHPRAHLRAFVLLPLLEIAPDCVLPGLGMAANWLGLCSDQGIARVGSTE